MTTIEYVNPALQKMAVTNRNPSPDPIDPDMIDYFTKMICQTPSKQSQCHFDLYVITDFDLIKNKIYYSTETPDPEPDAKHPQPYNPQVLAPLLLLLSRKQNPQKQRYIDNNPTDIKAEFQRDGLVAMGIAMGTTAYEACRLGYTTGYCACINSQMLTDILEEKLNREVTMINPHILAISKDMGQDPRLHAIHGKECYFDSQDKNHIEVTRIE